MKITVLIPHYRTGKMTAYSISQILKYKGNHEVKIVVIDNFSGDGSKKYLEPFMNDIVYLEYPKHLLQSHGIAFDWTLENGHVNTPYFLTLESDSFPTQEGWLDYYENLVKEGFDAAGSMLKLSGGLYLHCCGALYSKKSWEECNEYCKSIDYSYFPNMNKRQGFDFHIMIHNSVLDKVLENPEDYFELASGYKPYSKELSIEKRNNYKPTCGAFHNGMGNFDEDVTNYGQRGFDNGVLDVIIDNKKKIIRRVGYEPSQFFAFWLMANGKRLFSIPTEVKWMPNRENQQQEYTINECGLKHLWGISSYTERSGKDVEDIYSHKTSIPDRLYEFMPESMRIK